MDFACITLTVSDDAAVRITMNDFPLLEAQRPARMQWMEILNLTMLRDNSLRIEISGDPEVGLSGAPRLSRHPHGSVVAHDTGQILVAEMRDSTGAPIVQNPDGSFNLTGTGTVQAEARFVSFGPDFSTRLRSEAALNPEQAMGVGLATLRALERGNLDAILSLMDPLLHDVALVWQEPISKVRADIRGALAEVAQDLPPDGLEYALSTQTIGPLVRVLRDGGPMLQTMNRSGAIEAVFG